MTVSFLFVDATPRCLCNQSVVAMQNNDGKFTRLQTVCDNMTVEAQIKASVDILSDILREHIAALRSDKHIGTAVLSFALLQCHFPVQIKWPASGAAGLGHSLCSTILIWPPTSNEYFPIYCIILNQKMRRAGNFEVCEERCALSADRFGGLILWLTPNGGPTAPLTGRKRCV
jgi:hypothetical protein